MVRKEFLFPLLKTLSTMVKNVNTLLGEYSDESRVKEKGFVLTWSPQETQRSMLTLTLEYSKWVRTEAFSVNTHAIYAGSPSWTFMSLPLKQATQIPAEADTSNDPVGRLRLWCGHDANPQSPALPRLWKDRNPGCLSWALNLLSIALKQNKPSLCQWCQESKGNSGLHTS